LPSGRLVLVDDLGVDDVVVVRRRRGTATGRTTLRVLAVGLRRRFVELLREVLRRGHQPLGGGLDGLDVGAGERRLQVVERGLDRRLLVTRDLVALLTQQLLRLVHERVRVVAGLRLVAPTTVFLGVRRGVTDHLVDLVLAERRLTRDRHRLLLAGGAVL